MFTRYYTSKQLSRGDGMRIHPVSGVSFSELTYRKGDRRFVHTVEVIVAWGTEWVTRGIYGEIGDNRRDYPEGAPLPAHWIFNPWTEEYLQERKSA